MGRLYEVKAPLAMIEAFAQARGLLPAELGARLRLVWLGDGPLLDACRRRLDELGLSSVGWFPGARADVARLLGAMDVFAMSSLVEGIPIAVLEAMACGLPVVCPRVGGLPELVDDGQNGKLTEPRSVRGLAESFAFYAAHPEERLAQGSRGRRRAEERYSLDAVIDTYLRLYDTTLARGHSAAVDR